MNFNELIGKLPNLSAAPFLFFLIFTGLGLLCFESYFKKNLHVKNDKWLFIAALFIIAPNWTQTKCLSADEWIFKEYIPITEYYMTIKKE